MGQAISSHCQRFTRTCEGFRYLAAGQRPRPAKRSRTCSLKTPHESSSYARDSDRGEPQGANHRGIRSHGEDLQHRTSPAFALGCAALVRADSSQRANSPFSEQQGQKCLLGTCMLVLSLHSQFFHNQLPQSGRRRRAIMALSCGLEASSPLRLTVHFITCLRKVCGTSCASNY